MCTSVKKWYMYTCACICISQYVTLFLVNFLFFVAVNFDLYFIYMYYFWKIFFIVSYLFSMFVETNWVNKKNFDKKIALNCNNIPYIDNHITDSIPTLYVNCIKFCILEDAFFIDICNECTCYSSELTLLVLFCSPELRA